MRFLLRSEPQIRSESSWLLIRFVPLFYSWVYLGTLVIVVTELTAGYDY